MSIEVKVISLRFIFQVLYVLCFTRPRYQVSVYRTIGPLGFFFVQHPGQQFFSHAGTEPPLPGYLPVLLGSLGVLLKE